MVFIQDKLVIQNIKHVEKVYDKLNRVYKNKANQINMSPQNFIMTHLVKR